MIPEYQRTKILPKRLGSKPSNLPISGIPNSWKSKSIPRKSQEMQIQLDKIVPPFFITGRKITKNKHQPERWFNEIKRFKKTKKKKHPQDVPTFTRLPNFPSPAPPKGSLIPEPDWHIPLQQRLHNNPGVNQKVCYFRVDLQYIRYTKYG